MQEFLVVKSWIDFLAWIKTDAGISIGLLLNYQDGRDGCRNFCWLD